MPVPVEPGLVGSAALRAGHGPALAMSKSNSSRMDSGLRRRRGPLPETGPISSSTSSSPPRGREAAVTTGQNRAKPIDGGRLWPIYEDDHPREKVAGGPSEIIPIPCCKKRGLDFCSLRKMWLPKLAFLAFSELPTSDGGLKYSSGIPSARRHRL
jgi:hypothetical protein